MMMAHEYFTVRYKILVLVRTCVGEMTSQAWIMVEDDLGQDGIVQYYGVHLLPCIIMCHAS